MSSSKISIPLFRQILVVYSEDQKMSKNMLLGGENADVLCVQLDVKYSSLTNKCTFINLKYTLKFTLKYT